MRVNPDHVRAIYFAATGEDSTSYVLQKDWKRFCAIAEGIIAVAQRDALVEVQRDLKPPIPIEHMAKPFAEGFSFAFEKVRTLLTEHMSGTYALESRGLEAAKTPFRAEEDA